MASKQRGALDLGALPDSNHNFESVSGVLQELNHDILKAFFEKKRQDNFAKKAAALKQAAPTEPK